MIEKMEINLKNDLETPSSPQTHPCIINTINLSTPQSTNFTHNKSSLTLDIHTVFHALKLKRIF